MKSNTENQNNPFILFADDDIDTLEILKYHVDVRGWDADYARSAMEIIDQVNKNCCIEGQGCYDVIVADINYLNRNDIYGPRLSGITAAREIRKVHEDVPIIFLTGYDNALIRGEVRRINAFITTKPVLDYDKFFLWIGQLAQWHMDNHYTNNGRGGLMDDVRWQVDDIHTSTEERGKLSVPKTLSDAFKRVSFESLLRPRLALK